MINLSNLKSQGINIANPNHQDNFNKYLLEISKFSILTKEEEVELFKRIAINNDDKSAIDKVCNHNLRFVVSVAKKYAKLIQTSTLTLEDLVNEGNMGLCDSVRRFDYTTGNKFISYAVWRIQGYIIKSIQINIKNIRLPLNATRILNKIKKEESFLEQKLSRTPSTLEIFSNISENDSSYEISSVNKLDLLININNFEKSLNTRIGDESDIELIDMVASDTLDPNEILNEKQHHELIYELLESLPTLIKNYCIDYFGFYGATPMTYKELGVKYEDNHTSIRMRMDRYLRQARKLNRFNKQYFLSAIN